MSSCLLFQKAFLKAELRRVARENEKLNKMLNMMTKDFYNLQNQVMGLASWAPEKESLPLPRKRKEEDRDETKASNGRGDCSNRVESSSSEEDSPPKKQCKLSKTKISKLYVQTDPSDITSMVSSENFDYPIWLVQSGGSHLDCCQNSYNHTLNWSIW